MWITCEQLWENGVKQEDAPQQSMIVEAHLMKTMGMLLCV